MGGFFIPRFIVVGNGSLAVALDSGMRIRDLFYPLIGLENHIGGHKFRCGLWVNESFSWLGDENWNVGSGYLPETLVSKVIATNPKLNIELEINDSVYSFLNLFLRKLVVRNLDQASREIRIFFSQDFHIYGEEAGDTVLYDPKLNSMIHYKRNRYFLINGVTGRNEGFYEYAAGKKESFGKEGTWKDAEDGQLSKNPVAQGSVDSAVSFKLQADAKSESNIYYWIACGKSLEEVKELNSRVLNSGIEQLLLETENYWSAWVNKEGVDLTILPREIRSLTKTSLLVMRTHVDSGGGIIASCDSDVLQFNRDTYSYVWPRDGAICAMAFDTFGFEEVSRLFFEFCNRVITDEGYFRHKYWSDGSTGSSWHSLTDDEGNQQLPIQEDETALVLIALWKHFQRYRDLEFISKVYSRLVKRVTDFLLEHREQTTGLPKPTFDIWEERVGIYTSTASAVCSALSCAAKFSQVFYDRERQKTLNAASKNMKDAILSNLYDKETGRFIKAIYPDGSRDLTVDSSLLLSTILETFEPKNEIITKTVEAVHSNLWINEGVGGLARYENDDYHRVSKEVKGNPWPICTLWLSRYYSRAAESEQDLKRALGILNWTKKTALSSGLLAEQVNPFNAAPISVSPLIWSHAEFVLAVNEYLEGYKRIKMLEKSRLQK